jgi:hypothetical protein
MSRYPLAGLVIELTLRSVSVSLIGAALMLAVLALA